METIANSTNQTKILNIAVVALVTILIIAFAIAAIPTPTNYQWIVFFFLAATPAQIIIGILWQNNLPFVKTLGKKKQPLKGIILTIFAAIIGLLIGGFSLFVIGDSTIVPTPQLAHLFIIAIIVTIWLAIVVNFWPFVQKVKNSTLAGIGVWISAYLLAFIIWKVFFNYNSVASFVPWYVEILDPKGMFNFVPAIVFIITTCPIILYLSLFDNWLLEKWSGNTQPLKMIFNTLLVLLLSFLFQSVFTEILKIDMMVYMVMVPVCMVFGVFVVNNLTKFQLFDTITQPRKGIYKMLIATVMGLLMYLLYYNIAPLVTGAEIISGKEGNYQLDLWIADTMLGISFPLIIIVTGFFNFWPIVKKNN